MLASFCKNMFKQDVGPDAVACGYNICHAGSRVFVQEGIYDEFEKLVEKAKAWIVGDPFDPKVQQGPQVDKKQFEKILSYIEHGKKDGATLLTGGKRVGNKGYYLEPTIFSNVKEDMLIVQDEIFGPVISLMKFKLGTLECTPLGVEYEFSNMAQLYFPKIGLLISTRSY
ncbi:hypothetical protein TSUD_280810 [Trifolium subterraneum]|uniref:Aldehyde dehydrogenase domain-containing protein n=1 Tax=Trifolium subterraneum TaxID=3900 RepID=A0A2Z6PB37_TRISU|nr:hypothetical protein TSUD_280810 [Trifolium subterraneum]